MLISAFFEPFTSYIRESDIWVYFGVKIKTFQSCGCFAFLGVKSLRYTLSTPQPQGIRKCHYFSIFDIPGNFGNFRFFTFLSPLQHMHGFTPFWDFFNIIRLFRASRRFLGTIKIATGSWECILSDTEFWSTDVELVGNISITFSIE